MPFEEQTGCKTNVKIGNTSDEMVQLMSTGEYDGVSASGDATLRLIAADQVAPVNTDLVPNYADVYSYLKDQPWNSVDGQMFGIPHGWGANILMWNTDVVTEDLDSWGAVFEPDSPYAGKITAYDSPIYIADAALYLSKTQPDLGIKNPYALDQEQLDAAVALLKGQKSQLSSTGRSTPTSRPRSTTAQRGRHDVAGHHEPGRSRRHTGQGGRAEGRLDRLVGHVDGLVEGQAPQLHVHVDGLHHLAAVNAQMAEWFGEAPSNAEGVRRDRHRGSLHASSTRTTWRTRVVSRTGPHRRRTASTAAVTTAPTTRSGRGPGTR